MDKVLLVGVDTGEDEDFERSMKELSELVKACDMEPAGVVTQKMDTVNKAYYIGTGKVKEVKEYAQLLEVELVVFDNSFSPSQLRNLQRDLGKPILDRTALILDIFLKRAKTREAKLQVESARLNYLLSRLTGMREALTRQGGASGSMSSKGAGEKKLELDRRKIEKRLVELQRELNEVERERKTQSKRRLAARIPRVSLVGYTNAGKSTLLNAMVEEYLHNDAKKVMEKDMLFATLDTTVRRIDTGNNREFLLSDTVGFIRRLPHGLVKAFRSTLEEVKNADLLIYVIDYSDENYKRQIQVTRETLQEIGAAHIPALYVYNKADLCGICPLPRIIRGGKTADSGSPAAFMADAPSDEPPLCSIFLSAKSGGGIPELTRLISEVIYKDYVRLELLVPYEMGALMSYLMEHAQVEEQEYLEEGIHIRALCHRADMGKLSDFRR